MIAKRLADPRTPVLLLALALALFLAFNVWARHDIYFFYDEYDIVLHRYSLHDVLEPTNGHPVIMWLPIYYALRAIFGLGSALPFQLVGMLATALAGCLLFAYLALRAGRWVALGATMLVLFLGSGSDLLFWPFQLAFAGSIGAGLGALLVLELDRRRADAVAAALLVVSVFFLSLGLAFLAAAIAGLTARAAPKTREDWRRVARRAALVAGPALVLFAIWYLAFGHDSPSRITLENIGTTPTFAIEGIAASLAMLAGLAGTPADSSAVAWGGPLLIALSALGAWRLLRGPRIAPQIWVGLIGAAAFWVLTGLNQSPGAIPDAGRYDFVGAVFAVLVLVELLRGLRLGRGAVKAGALLIVVSVVGNASGYQFGMKTLDVEARNDEAALGALEIAKGRVNPEFRLDPGVSGSGYLSIVDAGPYFESAERYGSAALSPAELLGQPEPFRQHADTVLIAALGIKLAEAGASRGRDCRTVQPGDPEPAEVTLPAGADRTLHLHAGPSAPVEVGLQRFADTSTPLGTIAPGRNALLRIPSDRSRVPWQLVLGTDGTARACRLP